MPLKRAITLSSGLGLGLVLLAVFVTCRHGFFVGEGGRGRLGFAESSGLVASRQHPGVLWTHADSGAPPELFAIDDQGQLIGRFRIEGAHNVDWEDVAIDDAGHLFVGDIGNNESRRRDLVVYEIREPDPADANGDEEASVPVEAKVHYRFPDQTGFPSSIPNFDAESLFWWDGTLYLLSKHRADTRTTLYRFPSLDGRAEVVLEKIGDFDLGGGDLQFGGMATAADITPDGRVLAVLSYHAVFLFEAPAEGDDYLAAPLKKIDLKMMTLKQCEALAWVGEDLIITNETGRVFRLERPLDPAMTRFPPD
jgi:hypothetical protein